MKIYSDANKFSTLNVSVKFEPRDLWVGIYWTFNRSVESSYKRLKVYVCIVPLLPIIFDFEIDIQRLAR